MLLIECSTETFKMRRGVVCQTSACRDCPYHLLIHHQSHPSLEQHAFTTKKKSRPKPKFGRDIIDRNNEPRQPAKCHLSPNSPPPLMLGTTRMTEAILSTSGKIKSPHRIISSITNDERRTWREPSLSY